MNEFVVGLFIVAVIAMIAVDKVKAVKRQKAFEAAQKVIKDKISALEAQLAALKR